MAASFLLETTAKATVVLLMAWGVTTCMGARSSASARHLVWATALVAILLLPLATTLSPDWRVSVVPINWTSGAKADPTAQTASHRRFPTPSSSTAPSARVATERERLVDPGDLFESLGASSARLAHRPSVLMWLWGAGVLIGLLRLGVGLLWAAWIARQAKPVDDPRWHAQIRDASDDLGLAGVGRVLVSDRV